MKYQYHKVNPKLFNIVRTVLILGEINGTMQKDLPLFTNGIPALRLRMGMNCTKPADIQITLYGSAVPSEVLSETVNEIQLFYFFKPFTVSCLFNIPIENLNDSSIALSDWNPRIANKIKLKYPEVQA